jgi:phosphoribosyl-ATP pyrophosphohydrolase/phosphoribosyl-AMP cyclohydrolase
MSRTDRRIRGAAELDALVFDERGLLPVVSQEEETGEVLMLAWANREALDRSLATGDMYYWSRSRKELWRKGATSGNTQELRALFADCDGDAVLAIVRQTGPACHTGRTTCFSGEEVRKGAGARDEVRRDGAGGGSARTLQELWETLEARNRERPEGSYTTKLLTDENLRIKKLGEETAEVISALIRRDPSAAAEGADLVYHLMVALLGAGRSWSEVEEELARRRK